MRTPKHVVSFSPTTNAPRKSDVTGAFLPEQVAFSKVMRKLGATTTEHRFDNTRPEKRRANDVLGLIDASSDFDVFALFCHGWLDGVQAGFFRRNVKALAEGIARKASDDVTVILYCCSTGADPHKHPLSAAGTGDNSFADRLRDQLCATGKTSCRVVAHTTAAHTTRNPFVLFFEGMQSSIGGVGGIAPVHQKHTLWKPWRDTLREKPKPNDFRFRMPLMDVGEIHETLLKAR